MSECYYRLLLNDSSAASFTSFDKSYYGTLEQIDSLFLEYKTDKKLREIISIYDRYIVNEKKITHNVAYREVPFLIPVEVLETDTSVLIDHTWQHFNTWNCLYMMRCAKAENKHIWFFCSGEYSHCRKTRFTDLQYKGALGPIRKAREHDLGLSESDFWRWRQA